MITGLALVPLKKRTPPELPEGERVNEVEVARLVPDSCSVGEVHPCRWTFCWLISTPFAASAAMRAALCCLAATIDRAGPPIAASTLRCPVPPQMNYFAAPAR